MAIIDNTVKPPRAPARRSFLTALTAAAVAAPLAASAPALAAAAAPMPQENPELLAIGAKIPDLMIGLHAAKARMDEARTAFDRLKPTVPPEIVAPEGHRWAKMVRNIDNEPARSEDGSGFLDIYDHKQVRAYVILREIPRTKMEGRQLRRIARLAQKFEKDHAAAVRDSDFWEAHSAMLDLRMELQEIAKVAREIKPSTPEGLAVYAAIIIAGAGPSYEHPQRGQYEHFGIAIAEALTAGAGRSS
jgi:hypothetical protein